MKPSNRFERPEEQSEPTLPLAGFMALPFDLGAQAKNILEIYKQEYAAALQRMEMEKNASTKPDPHKPQALLDEKLRDAHAARIEAAHPLHICVVQAPWMPLSPDQQAELFQYVRLHEDLKRIVASIDEAARN
jgi:hypothetical protein